MTTAAELRSRLPEVMLVDRDRLARRIDAAARAGDRVAAQRLLTKVAEELERSAARLAARVAAAPSVTYPPQLPITARRGDIMAAIQAHQVVIVAGETGSGKTTQLPKMCLELGRGRIGLIGHTQPRRLAARSVADRIAAELGTTPGTTVGSQVRFDSRVGEQTLIKLMTDGILLAELAGDPRLNRYDTLIIDEAHERSLTIDFILGYLHRLLPRRPELKLIITSATIDPVRFAEHFSAGPGGAAPIIEVSGRTYPVQIRYRPLLPAMSDDEELEPPDAPVDHQRAGADVAAPARGEPRDQVQAICDAVDELSGELAGDVLVFLSGEREIRDTAEALAQRDLAHTEILPLYARLSVAHQHRIFAAHAGRRIVLATNIAETSLTVPGIRYVIDPGTARISRYSNRLKVQRLPIEPISQASADQRAGRCGRTSEGICIRLYAQADYDARPRFTEPEILRTSLAAVILQMMALGLGEIDSFPFIDPPDRRTVHDGIELLRELGAVQSGEGLRLTPVGRRLAQLPIDPRLGRMLLAAQENGCAPQVLVIAAALSIQDPRERPTDAQAAASAMHTRFADTHSDFLSLLNLWNYLQERQQVLSGNQFRRLCRAEYLNYLRVREWQDLVSQLRQALRASGREPGTPVSAAAPDTPAAAAPDAPAAAAADPGASPQQDPPSLARSWDPQQATRIHTSLLAGLLSHVGVKQVVANAVVTPVRPPGRPPRGPQEYLGARGARFAIVAGSAVSRSTPRWVMAGELVQTSRLWARTVARIEPQWLEPLAGHLVRRSYAEPHWSRSAAAVQAFESVSLFGLTIVARRTVNLAAIDPQLCHELFIRHALVEGDWDTRHRFFHDNRELLDRLEQLQQRARRADIVPDDLALFDFYRERVAAEVVSGRHFDAWWRRTRAVQPDLLTLTASTLPATGHIDPTDYPDRWRQGELSLPLTYRFEPGATGDGVSVQIPLPLLGQVSPAGFDWQIPGWRAELLVALLRSLPKPVRRHLVPIPDRAATLRQQLHPGQGPLLAVLEAQLRRTAGVEIRRADWRLESVPEYLRITFRVLDTDGSLVAEGKDLAALQSTLVAQVRRSLSAAAGGIEQGGLTAWSFGTLPRTVSRAHAGYQVTGYPAVTDEVTSVAVRVYDTPAVAAQAMWRGTRRLLLLGLPAPATLLASRLPHATKLALSRSPYPGLGPLLQDCASAAVDTLMAQAGGPAFDESGFAALREVVRAGLVAALSGVVDQVQAVLRLWYELDRTLSAPVAPPAQPAYADLRAQLDELVGPGFIAATGAARMDDVQRYLQAMRRRLERLPGNLTRDAELTRQVEAVRVEYRDLVAEVGDEPGAADRLTEIRWMIQELRVNLFAQALGTAYPVSAQRIYRAMDALAPA